MLSKLYENDLIKETFPLPNLEKLVKSNGVYASFQKTPQDILFDPYCCHDITEVKIRQPIEYSITIDGDARGLLNLDNSLADAVDGFDHKQQRINELENEVAKYKYLLRCIKKAIRNEAEDDFIYGNAYNNCIKIIENLCNDKRN